MNGENVGTFNKTFLRRDSIALAIFLALTCVMTNPLVLHLARAVEDKQDALLNTWIIAWVGHALITDPLNLFNANIFYPYPNALAFSETLLPQGLFALPFNLAFDNTVLGYNLVLLASFFLAAYAMYLLVFDLTRARGAAIVAGTIFAFNPYNLGNLAQVQLLSFGWMPLAMMFLRRLLTTDRRPPTGSNFRFSIFDFRLSFLFALFFSLQALSSFYYAFLAGFAVALYMPWFFITHHASRITYHASLFTVHRSPFTIYRSLFTRLLVSVVLIALIVVPFFIPYLQVQREMGFERKVIESEPFSASLKMYAQVAPQNVLYGNLLAPHPPILLGGYPLDNLFPGVVALALAILGVAAARDRDKWFYFLLLAFAFLLSLGPRLYLAPNVGTEIALPYRWLYDAFPLMRALRAPVRFDALVMFALAVLAGFGTRRIANSKWRMARNHFILHPSSFILPLIALEYLTLPAAQITPVPVWNEIPEYVRWLRAQPPGVVLELPMIASDPSKPLDLTTQYFSTYHWHATPDGYSGFNPPRRGEIAYEMQSFPSERARSLLNALDVRYLVVREPRLRADDLELARQFGDDRVYRVPARAQDVSQLSARLYLPSPAAPNQNYFAYVIVQNRGARSFAIKPTENLRVIARWNDDAPTKTTAPMPLVTSSASVVPVRLVAPPRAGAYRLRLEIGEWKLPGEVIVAEEEPARQIVLPARVELNAPLKSSYAPGDTIEIWLTWHALNKIDAYYSASVRVVDARGSKIVAQDRQPRVPTLLWRPGDAIADPFEIVLPRDLAPGEYFVQVKMYQADQGVDALLLDENFAPQETMTLGKFAAK
ncbi:MAG: hypothetical protein FJ009_01460 [Chloroflexi bacterium]|nr:hypothetical protein [Chloroflexota bacterium]